MTVPVDLDQMNAAMSRASIGPLGRTVYGATEPGASTPCRRQTALSEREVAEVVELIARGRLERQAVELPEPLRTRSWDSVEAVVLALESRLSWGGIGWKVGAESRRRARSVAGPHLGPGCLPWRFDLAAGDLRQLSAL